MRIKVAGLRRRMEDSAVERGILDLALALDWYALLVPPQKEFVAQKILRRFGLHTYVPVRREYRRRNRFVRDKELRTFPIAPRYVFAGFDGRCGEAGGAGGGGPDWAALFALPVVSGIVVLEGRFAKIRAAAMAEMIRATGGGPGSGLEAPTAERFMRTHREFRAGERAEIVAGPFAGHVVPVKRIDGRKARVLLALFGGAIDEVEMPVEYLEAA